MNTVLEAPAPPTTLEEVSALPVKATTYVSGERSRKGLTAWVLETGTNDSGEEYELQAQLSTYHNRDRKSYGSLLQRVTVTKGTYGYTESFWMFSGLRVANKPVARHSMKNLQAAHEEALQVLAAALLMGAAAAPKAYEQFDRTAERMPS